MFREESAFNLLLLRNNHSRASYYLILHVAFHGSNISLYVSKANSFWLWVREDLEAIFCPPNAVFQVPVHLSDARMCKAFASDSSILLQDSGVLTGLCWRSSQRFLSFPSNVRMLEHPPPLIHDLEPSTNLIISRGKVSERSLRQKEHPKD